ncbi:MAG TPA: class I SAM-dependent methyltransferase [Patescibacteria group bacterium]
MKKDRFEKISNNYGELFSEVFAEQSLDYKRLQLSVFENVSKLDPDFRNKAILDIGVGDGATSAAFVEAGCKNIIGIDLNPEMLEAARRKLGRDIELLQMDATDMGAFESNRFAIIISATMIHNIPKSEREKFWKELLRLAPEIFVSADKIADPNPELHKLYYDNEIAAIKKIYGEKHNLPEAEATWLEHYECDERERLELEEIKKALGDYYDIHVAFEMGVNKTIVATKKTQP